MHTLRIGLVTLTSSTESYDSTTDPRVTTRSHTRLQETSNYKDAACKHRVST